MISITSEVAGSPGLLPVVQVIDVVVAPETGHATPSMTISYLEVSVTKFVPVKVIASPPTTVPNLGLIAVNKGVRAP